MMSLYSQDSPKDGPQTLTYRMPVIRLEML
jgi:hypothetical protein